MTYATTALLALSAVSAATTAYAGYTQAQTSKKIAEHNAQVQELQAQDALKRGEQARIEARRRGSAIEGQQRNALAARGLSLDEGTPSDLLAGTDFFSQSDQATARTNGRKEAWMDRQGAANSQLQADAAAPGLSLVGGLLSGASSVAEKWYTYSNMNSNGELARLRGSPFNDSSNYG